MYISILFPLITVSTTPPVGYSMTLSVVGEYIRTLFLTSLTDYK